MAQESTVNSDVVAAVNARKLDLRIGQKQLEAETGLSQGHLSKILSKKVPLTEKSRAALEKWLAANSRESRDVTELVAALRGVSGDRRATIMQIMQLLAQLLR